MKRAVAVCVIFVLAVVLISCGGKEMRCADILHTIGFDGNDGAYTVYLPDSAHRDENERRFRKLYNAERDGFLASDLDDYAVVLSRKEYGFEIHLLRLRHLSEVERYTAFFRSRIRMLQNAQVARYSAERYEDCFAGAEIYVSGNLICLLCTQNNGDVVDAIREAVR
ncbi:MAG: hypothetical protein IJU52_06070 [Clostridia bacterium]|nr:hypothetical protein [Clostridia bacterium]